MSSRIIRAWEYILTKEAIGNEASDSLSKLSWWSPQHKRQNDRHQLQLWVRKQCSKGTVISQKWLSWLRPPVCWNMPCNCTISACMSILAGRRFGQFQRAPVQGAKLYRNQVSSQLRQPLKWWPTQKTDSITISKDTSNWSPIFGACKNLKTKLYSLHFKSERFWSNLRNS